ncbi:hypothetical protein ACKLNO_10960 [Neisseriaceae bacterium B1]
MSPVVEMAFRLPESGQSIQFYSLKCVIIFLLNAFRLPENAYNARRLHFLHDKGNHHEHYTI